METPEQVTYDGGAKRSEKLPAYHDVSHNVIRRGAMALSEGHVTYEQGFPVGAKNYKLGDRQFALDVFDHAIAHLLELKEQALDGLNGDPDPFGGEDHLGHLVANLVMIDFFQAKDMYTPEPETEPEPSQDEINVASAAMLAPLPENDGVVARLKRILAGANA